jgi:hypothetical protein
MTVDYKWPNIAPNELIPLSRLTHFLIAKQLGYFAGKIALTINELEVIDLDEIGKETTKGTYIFLEFSNLGDIFSAFLLAIEYELI